MKRNLLPFVAIFTIASLILGACKPQPVVSYEDAAKSCGGVENIERFDVNGFACKTSATQCTAACAESVISTLMADVQNSCIATGGRLAWEGSSLKSFEWAALVSREALEQGFTLQPFFDEAAPDFIDILGYTVPETFEPMNDGAQTLTCFDEHGKPYTWVFDRFNATSVPFNHISAWKLNRDGSLTVWYNDDSGPGGWDGNGSGAMYTYYKADAFESWSDLLSEFSDEAAPMSKRVDEIKGLIDRLNFYPLPAYAEITAFWK